MADHKSQTPQAVGMTGSDVRQELNSISVALDWTDDYDHAALRMVLDSLMPRMDDNVLVAFAEAALKHLGAAAEYRKGV